MLYFVYKILTLRFFSQLLRRKERGEGDIFSGKELWCLAHKLKSRSGPVLLKDEHCTVPERNCLNLANSQGFEKASPFMFSAVAVEDTDAAAPICVCLHHSCLGWTQPICCCCFSLLRGCGELSFMNVLCFSCCCPLSRKDREIWFKKPHTNAGNVWVITESRLA